MSLSHCHCQLLNVRKTIFLNAKSWRTVSVLSHETHSKAKKSIKEAPRYVYVSMAKDIFSNLALEHWLYQNIKLNSQRILLLWWNDPCVVIGRHQNPWSEVNIQKIKEKGMVLARRNSGGGTVYHDKGNLNLSFLSPRDLYNRKENLEVICAALRKKWNLDVTIGKRDDIYLDTFYKISGTASKLGASNSYHHCTLLVDVDKENLNAVLSPEQIGISSKATASIPSLTRNLIENVPSLTTKNLASVVAEEFLSSMSSSLSRGVHLVNPSESWFPGITAIRNEFISEEWIYNKTPKFTFTKVVPVPSHLQSKLGSQLELLVTIEHGKIVEINQEFSNLNLLGKMLNECTSASNDYCDEVQNFLLQTFLSSAAKFQTV